MQKNINKGFTLIELLVVVAIIGILASVILANLNSARVKGTDAAIKATLANARAQAALFYDAGQVYTNVCTDPNGVGTFILNAAQKLNIGAAVNDNTQAFAYDNTGLVAGTAVCHDDPEGWVAVVSLKGVAGSGWCVDSAGASKEVTTLDVAGTYPDGLLCP